MITLETAKTRDNIINSLWPGLIILLFLLFLPNISFSQESAKKNKDGFFLFESENVFVPLKASIFESRVGMIKNLNDDYLRLDIGASFDLAGYRDSGRVYSLGLDFFTFSNLRSESNFKFPVDAIDYFFGINFNYRKEIKRHLTVMSRLRVSHISSHFQDGHKYERTDTVFTPVVYSREFINLAGILEYRLHPEINMKYLLGLEYLFKSIPDEFGALSLQFGTELRYNILNWLTYYISDEVRMVKVDALGEDYNFNNNLETGLRFGFANTKGINIFFTYYDGQDYKGQYFDRMTNYKAIGFSADF